MISDGNIKCEKYAKVCEQSNKRLLSETNRLNLLLSSSLHHFLLLSEVTRQVMASSNSWTGQRVI